MKRLLLNSLALVGLLSLSAAFVILDGTPVVNFSAIKEIAELYEDGQYDVVKAKLANQGFVVTSSEPDYTLHGRTHEGTFTMTYETDSPSATYRQYGWKERSIWRFSAEKDAHTREANVDFELHDRYSQNVYNDFVRLWEQFNIESDHVACNTNETCTRFWGAVGGAPIGFHDYVRSSYGFRQGEIKEQDGQITSVPSFRGSITYRRMKDEPQPVKVPMKQRKTVNKRK